MQDVEYGKVNITVRVHENHLLRKSHYDRMLQADTYEEALRVLMDTKYREDVETALRTKNYEDMLFNELKKTYDWVLNEIPDEKLAELIALEYAYHNIKVLFKETVTEKDFDQTLIEISKFPLYEFRKAVATQASTVLPEDYMVSIRELHAFFNEAPSINDIDIFVDRTYSAHLVKLAEEINQPEVSQFVQKKIDLKNLSIFFRALVSGHSSNHIQAVLSDSGTIPIRKYVDLAGADLNQALNTIKDSEFGQLINKSYHQNEFSLSLLERQIDDAGIEYLSQAKMKAFGPLPVLAYVNAVETEIKNLRLILTSKLNSIDPEIVRDRMRLNYAI